MALPFWLSLSLDAPWCLSCLLTTLLFIFPEDRFFALLTLFLLVVVVGQIPTFALRNALAPQHTRQKKHTIPAHLTAVTADDIHGFTDAKSHADVINTLSSHQDTIIDLWDPQAADNSDMEFCHNAPRTTECSQGSGHKK